MRLDPIDPSAAEPPFEQLRRQIASRASAGELPAGTRLPTVRALAADVGLAVNTVARVYRELEADGVVTTHGRHGTVISGPPHEPPPAADLLAAARSYAGHASRTGASLEDALTAVRVAFAVQRAA